MSPGAGSIVGGRVVLGLLARGAEERPWIEVHEHFAGQECSEQHEQADDDCSHHGVSLPFCFSGGLWISGESGDNVFKLQRFSRQMRAAAE